MILMQTEKKINKKNHTAPVTKSSFLSLVVHCIPYFINKYSIQILAMGT